MRIALLFIAAVWCECLAAQNKVLMPLSHREGIDKVILSPDGRYAVTADWNKCILWELSSGFSIAQYNRSHTNASDICFSKNSEQLVVCNGKNLNIFTTKTGQLFKQYNVAALVAAYYLDSADKVLIVTNDKLVEADIASGKILHQVNIGNDGLMAYTRLVLSRDNRFLFAVEKGGVSAINVETGARTSYTNDCITANRYPAFAENGTDLVAVSCSLGPTFLFDRETGKALQQLDLPFNVTIDANGDTTEIPYEHSDYYSYGAQNIEFLAGKRLMIHKDDEIQLWDLNTMKKLSSVPAPYSKEYFIADSGRVILMSSKGYGIYNGNTGKMEQETRFTEPFHYTNYVGESGKLYSYNAKNQLLIGVDTSQVIPVIVNLRTNNFKKLDTRGISDLTKVLLLPSISGPTLYCGYENFCVGWDLKNARSIFSAAHNANYGKYSRKSALGSDIECSPSGKWLVTAFNDFFNIFNFNTVSTCEFFRLSDHRKTGSLSLVDAFSISDNDRLLFQRYEEKQKVIGILNLNNNEQKIISRDSLRAKLIAISSSGRFTAFVRDDHVYVYDALSDQLTRGDEYQNWREEIDRIMFSPDEKSFVVLGFEAPQIPLYNAANGKLLRTLQPSSEEEKNRIYEWASFRDANTLMAKMSGYMYLFNVKTGTSKHFEFGNVPLQKKISNPFWAMNDFGDTLVYCRLNNRDSVDMLRKVPVPSRNVTLLGDQLISNNGKGATWYKLTAADTLTFLAEIYNLDESNSMFLTTPWYKSDKGASEQLKFLQQNRLLSFEQLDLEFNRPDKVLQSIGSSDSTAISSYKRAYYKRLQRLGIDTTRFTNSYAIPFCRITNKKDEEFETASDSMQISIHATDTAAALSRLNVWINDVPVQTSRGIRITAQHTFDSSIAVRLSTGDNHIEVSVTNADGIESYRDQLFVRCTASRSAAKIYFIGIGIDKFLDSTHNLSWSVKDIRDLSARLSSKFPGIMIDTLFNGSVTKEKILSLKKRLLTLDVDDKVIVSYSGHGLLSTDLDYYLSTWNIDFSHPEKNGLPYEEMEMLLDGIAPRQKLVFIDACHSGEVDKAEVAKIEAVNPSLDSSGMKGRTSIRIIPSRKLGMTNTFELMQNLFVNVSRGTGATVIAAAGAMQYAQERGDLKNGVFTYSILDAFAKNNSLTVAQLKKQVESSVTALTNGLQQPTSRTGTHLHDWRVW